MERVSVLRCYNMNYLIGYYCFMTDGGAWGFCISWVPDKTQLGRLISTQISRC
jgi:hypothetical protein